MPHAYNPGLRVAENTLIYKERKLPLSGKVIVEQGDVVSREQVVAKTNLPGDVVALNLVNRLGCSPKEVPDFMLYKEGDMVESGSPIAITKPIIKWFETTVSSPVTAVVESISSVTGQVILRKPPKHVEVQAYIRGKVVNVFQGEGVGIQTKGTIIQGIFGVGGEAWGTIEMAVQSPYELVQSLPEQCAGKILVVGRSLTMDIIIEARKKGVAGLITGGIRDQDLKTLLGYDLGVAITGDEDIGITVVVTEGFGDIAIAQKSFDIFQKCSGKKASVSGVTQIRAGVMRPEIVVPSESNEYCFSELTTSSKQGIEEGDLLRVIRVPFFGRLGRVRSLPADLHEVESGARVRVLEVEFDDGERAIVPRANVEIIEE